MTTHKSIVQHFSVRDDSDSPFILAFELPRCTSKTDVAWNQSVNSTDTLEFVKVRKFDKQLKPHVLYEQMCLSVGI